MSEAHLTKVKQWYAEREANPKVAAHVADLIDANRAYIDPDTDQNISSAELDQAEARLRDAKAAKEAGTMDVEEYKAISKEVVKLRQIYRLQEHAAERRHKLGIVGGDASITGV